MVQEQGENAQNAKYDVSFSHSSCVCAFLSSPCALQHQEMLGGEIRLLTNPRTLSQLNVWWNSYGRRQLQRGNLMHEVISLPMQLALYNALVQRVQMSPLVQYDVELYQRIEHLLGRKLDAYPCEEDTVLVMLERVNEAQRMATIEMKDMNNGSTKRKRYGHQDEDTSDNEKGKTLKFAGRGQRQRRGGRGGRGRGRGGHQKQLYIF